MGWSLMCAFIASPPSQSLNTCNYHPEVFLMILMCIFAFHFTFNVY